MRAFAVGMLALITASLLAAVSGTQITSEGPATRALMQGTAALTEIDAVLSTHYQDLLVQAEQGSTTRLLIPTYPLAVSLTREEVQTRSLQELRELVMQRSAELVYRKGTSAFSSQTGGNDQLALRPLGGVIEMTLDYLTVAWHQRYRSVLIATLVLAALFGGLLLLGSEPHHGLMLVGVSIGVGALLFLAAVTLLMFAVTSLKNGADDEITRLFLSLNQEALAGIRRNGVIGVLLGLILIIFGVIVGVLGAQSRADQLV